MNRSVRVCLGLVAGVAFFCSERPVAAIDLGQRMMSSAESFALMLAQCPQVTTMGDRTAGSSGNPRQVIVADGRITVNLPRWLDMGPDGKPIEGVGIASDVAIEATPEEFSETSDPVLVAAMKNLRSRPAGKGADVPAQRSGAKSSSATPSKRFSSGVTKNATDRPQVVSVFPPDGATDVTPITEICIRFDRPMSPLSALLAWDNRSTGGFRLRGLMHYDADRNEFVIPVSLTRGIIHQLRINEHLASLPPTGFRSADGVAARRYAWKFTTRDSSASSGADAPRLVSVDPPSGSKTSVFTPIQLPFDRPMVPERYEVLDVTSRKPGETGLSIPFPVRYDAESKRFVIPVLLPPGKTCRIELRGLWSAEGGRVEPIRLQYEVGNKLLSDAQQVRINTAAHSETLRQVVEAVRKTRLAITSLEETVQTVVAIGNGPMWLTSFQSQEATFRFQGKRQFFADISDIMMSLPFLVGSDGRQCWNRRNDDLVICPFDQIDDKNVLFCDPFGFARFDTAKEAIDALKLEYLGSEQFAGRVCHRIRSWRGRIGRMKQMSVWWVTGLVDWLIDAKTHLPVSVERAVMGSGYIRSLYSYRRIGEPMADAEFQPPLGSNVPVQKAKPLGDGFDRRFLNVRDGTDGCMSVRWGKTGPKGRSSSGLN